MPPTYNVIVINDLIKEFQENMYFKTMTSSNERDSSDLQMRCLG